MAAEQRKIALTRYWLFKFGNWLFRMVVPILIAGFVWGFIDLNANDYDEAIQGILVSTSEFQVDGLPITPDEDEYYIDTVTEAVYMFYNGIFVPAELQRPSFWDNLSAGVFVALLVFGTEIKDQASAFMEKMKQRKRWVFLKNRTFIYMLSGTILLFAYMIAKDAMIFCFGSAVSCMIAYVFELQQNRYYDLLYPPEVTLTHHA